jgi:hypothetical protein
MAYPPYFIERNCREESPLRGAKNWELSEQTFNRCGGLTANMKRGSPNVAFGSRTSRRCVCTGWEKQVQECEHVNFC